MIDFSKINWLAVAACVVLGVVMGMTWYGVLFTETWAAGNGITFTGEGAAMKAFKGTTEMVDDPMNYVFNTLSLIANALLMSWLFQRTNTTTWQDGALLGAGILGLLTLIGVFTGNMFAANPVSLSMVDGSYSFVMFTLFGAILGGWQKKRSQTNIDSLLDA